MLVHVSVADPLTFAASSVFLGLVAVLASYIPAHRATSAEPMATLRSR
jgi:ABC-type lipoprotein release transport system permease subunit